ncbi:hypothetical protein AVEN_179630-1 [Araneus ventricosus]|uniref:DUF4817 domain-containing protein n=1 Tax=Araneus ventricosus TaxID=182803 RepID=A0A4Y2BC21_ARAVE|nr:hypothetical protein AVEN_179630-1 [Araneus ventricosus]
MSTTETLEHLPYNRECGITWTSRHVISSLRTVEFRTEADVQEAVVKRLRDLNPDFFYAGFDKLVHQWPKCFNNHGDYVEK